MTLEKLGYKVVRPHDLCFTQESICVTFQRPRNQERIDDAVDLIIQGRLSPKAFPKMNVVEFQDRLWSLDNRRLWVFKKAEVNFVTVTLVALDFHDRFSTLPSTSPYLYANLSNPDFFPRIRGHCKEHFFDDDPDVPSSLSPPPTPHGRVRPEEMPTKMYMQSTPAAPSPVPRPSKQQKFPPPSKVATKSKYLDCDDHHHEPVGYDNRHRESLDYDRHYHGPSSLKRQHSDFPHLSRMRGTGTPPLSRKHSTDGSSPPKSKKRPHEAVRHSSRTPHEDLRHPSRRPHEATHHPSRTTHEAVRHTSRSPNETVRRPPKTPNEACSAPPAKKLRAPSQAREFEASSPAPKPTVLTPPEDRRAALPSRRANAPYLVREPRKPTRSSERKADGPGNLPPHRTAEPNTLGADRHPERQHYHDKRHSLPPLPADKFAQRGGEAKSSKSRAVAPSPLAPKRSKISKPSSNPKPFSYDFHSGPKRSKASKSSKKTVSSPSTKSPSTHLHDDPVPHTSMPSSASPKGGSASPKVAQEPLPSLSTTASLSATKKRHRDDSCPPDLPIPPVFAPEGPPLTCSPKKKHGHQSDHEFHSSNFGTSLDPVPLENHHHHSIGMPPPTKTRQESPGLVDCDPEIGFISETEKNLFELNKQPAVELELPLPPTPPKPELNIKADQLSDYALVEIVLKEINLKYGLQSAQTRSRVEYPPKQPNEPENPHQLSQTPVELIDLTQQPDEPHDVHESVVECPVQYDVEGQLVESTLKVLRPLKAPSTAYYGDGDVRRAAGNVDVTVTASPELPEPQLSTPVSRREAQETQSAPKASNAASHQHVTPSEKCWRNGYLEMARTANNDVSVKLSTTTQKCPRSGNEVPEISHRITRSQIKMHRDRERRERREKRKGIEADKKKEREADKKKGIEAEKTKEREAEQKREIEVQKKKEREAEKKKEREAEKKKEREAEKKKEREAEKKKEREAEKKKEREAVKKKEQGSQALLRESKPRSASRNRGTEIVPYDAARNQKVSSGAKTVTGGDMVYVRVSGEITESDTEEQNGTSSNGSCSSRLHPYLRTIGPFRVIRLCNGYAAVLELPNDCDLRPVFCLSSLTKTRCPLDNPFPNKRLSIKLKPEAILSKRVARRLRKRKVLHYLVKWRTLPATEATWEPESIFDEHPFLLDQIDSPLFTNPYMLRNWRA